MKIIKTEYITESNSSLYIRYKLPIYRTTIQYDSLIYNIIDPVIERFVNSDGIYWLVKFSTGNYMRISVERTDRLEKEYKQLIRKEKIKRII